jgi:hypothetical protein
MARFRTHLTRSVQQYRKTTLRLRNRTDGVTGKDGRMFKRLLTSCLTMGLALAPAALAAQQSNCAPRDAVIERLTEKYAEQLTAGGLQSENTVLEVWTSENTGSFTVLLTYANGMTCIMASGHNWSSVAQVMMDEDSAS